MEKFYYHSQASYHKTCVLAAENFLKVYTGKQEDVATLLDKQRQKEKEENRKALKPIIETIIFCGENELPLRGSIDSGPVTLEKPVQKDGKFRAILRYRAHTDEDLKHHLTHSSRNATYTSPEIQNEVVGICGELIQKKIITEVNNSECFSILGDETLDVSGQEQFSLCIRYVSNEDHPMLREDFVAFFPVTDLCGEYISRQILQLCRDLGLEMTKLVGQGYDGAANMSGSISGVKTRIQELYPKAMYVHCASHRLNLVLSESLSVPSVTNALGVVKETTNLFRFNSQAGSVLKTNISKLLPDSKKSRLLGLCETRFIERHEAVNNFVELLPAIVPSLQELSQCNRSFSSSASSLLAAMEKGNFIVSLFVCEYLFSLTLPLSSYLQNPQHDLASAISYSESILKMFQALRASDSDDHKKFAEIFLKSVTTADNLFGTSVEIPRQAMKQTTRSNHPHKSVEEYYLRSIFLPCVDGFIVSLQQRFGQNKDILSALEILLPKHAHENCVKEINKLSLYFQDKTSQAAVEAEYLLWCEKWKDSKSDIPNGIMSILEACNKHFYPTIRYLLSVLATLPVSTAEVERSFSSMKRVKTYLRNTMCNERLTGLALMSIHYPLPFTSDDILHVMARKPNRRMVL